MTVKEVANNANVSVSTVYRVLEGNPSISEATAQRVREVMNSMGMVPAVPRRRGRKRKQTVKGEVAFVLLGAEAITANIQLVRGVEAALAGKDLKLIFTQATDFEALAEDVVRSGYAGVILHGWHVDRPSAAAAAKLSQVPTVWLMTHNEDWGDQVQPDNVAIGQMAARYLLSRGHRCVAYLMPEKEHLAFEIRGQAFCDAINHVGTSYMMKAGEIDSQRSIKDQASEIMTDLVAKLLQVAQVPTGVFVADDSYVPSLYNLLVCNDVRPGADIAVVSCGCKTNSLVGLSPPPVSIDMDMERIGRKAVEQLFWRIQNPNEKIRMLIRVIPENLKSS